MKTKNEIIQLLKREYEDKKRRNYKKYEQVQQNLYKNHIELEKIQTQMRILATTMFKDILNTDDNKKNLQKEYQNLQKEYEEYIQKYNLQDVFKIPYDCDVCKDEGIIVQDDGFQKYCSCYNNRYISLMYKNSNISELFEDCNFENFDLDIFDDAKNINGQTQRQKMTYLKHIGQNYVQNMNNKNQNSLIFWGNVGTGKTYLSIAMAKSAIENGFTVLYTSANDFFDKYRKYTNSNDDNSPDKAFVDFLKTGDLLILDDLGNETSSEYKISTFFDIVNIRLLKKLKTIISTNLNPQDINKNYDARIYSRLKSGYDFFEFIGDDIRKKSWIKTSTLFDFYPFVMLYNIYFLN